MPMRHGKRRDEEKTTVKRPDTELIPIWGHSPGEEETVSAGALVAERQTDEQETR